MQDCPFCQLKPDRVFYKTAHVLALWDGYPVSPGHALIIPKRHVAAWADASVEERHALTDAISIVRGMLRERYEPAGFNVGFNDGVAAGQTVMHLHIHVIPRYEGDSAEPRGGVRWVLPGKAAYWEPSEG